MGNKALPRTSLIDTKHPGPTTSSGIQDIAEGCWSMLGNHERKDVQKKLAEQPRMNPVNTQTMKSGGGGE